MYAGWVAASSGKAKHISANANNITISSLFTEAEWRSGSTKTVVVEAGVTVGSTSYSAPALKTGTTLGGFAMGGRLSVINNGFIYGAGGSGGGAGGTALEATVPVNFTNNGNLYGGGGSGAVGGTGEGGWYWPENKTWKYNLTWYWGGIDPGNQNYWGTWYSGLFVNYDLANPDVDFTHTSVHGTDLTVGDYKYYRGDNMGTVFLGTYYKLRRKLKLVQVGGAGGSGGVGQGSNNLVADPGGAYSTTIVSHGGNGGNGANWGATGGSSVSGGWSNSTYTDATIPRTLGQTGGLGGYYINGNSNVTWVSTGNRLGRVTG